MIRSISILLVSILFFACGTKKKVVENTNTSMPTTKEVAEEIKIYINTYANGYAPLEIENKVTKPLETALLSSDDVTSIKSTSEEEYSKIIVFLDSKISKEKALKIVQNKVVELIVNGKLPIINNQQTQPKVSLQNNFDKKYVIEDSPFDHVDTTQEGTDGYVTDEGESVTVETVFHENKETTNHNVWNTLLQKHVTEDGVVNYKGFKKERTEIQNYITSLSENMPLETWSKEAKLVYWINAYNAMTVDLILRNYPTKSIKDISKPWNQRLWKLGNKWYNLDEIEHKILRKMNEPRIHFAINCASFSCPPLLNEAFTERNLEAQLTQVTKVFLADSRRNTITANKLEISKIFKWFSKDFKQNGSLIDFLNKYSDIKINANAKKKYKDYDWNLNE